MGNGCRDAMISHCKDRGETRETPTYDDSFGGGLGIPIPVCTENLNPDLSLAPAFRQRTALIFLARFM
jgi:hypothetical protein